MLSWVLPLSLPLLLPLLLLLILLQAKKYSSKAKSRGIYRRSKEKWLVRYGHKGNRPSTTGLDWADAPAGLTGPFFFFAGA